MAMSLPGDEDGPAWLADYGDIHADIDSMEQFAARLAAEVRDNYASHVSQVLDLMSAGVVAPEGFVELRGFLQAHWEAQDRTFGNVYSYRDVTGGFANAAGDISARYRGVDAFAAARVSDVDEALQRRLMPPAGVGGPGSGSEVL